MLEIHPENHNHPVTAINAHQLLWSRLRNRQLSGFTFTREQPIGPYIVDFYCATRKLVVELIEQPAHMQVRDRFFEHMGLEVLYLDQKHILQDVETMLQIITRTLRLDN